MAEATVRDSWDLVAAAQCGDRDAFAELYGRYAEMVLRYVMFRMGDRPLAEDLTSETFLRALRSIGSVSCQGRDLGAWLVTIARNLIYDHVKSAHYRLSISTGDIVQVATDSVEQAVIDADTAAELWRHVAELTAEQRECIRLRFRDGLSVPETAAAMGRGEGAVKALQHRGVRRLAALRHDGEQLTAQAVA